MICFDTTILIWGVQGQASSDQEGMIDQTRRYIASLHDANERIMVPTPALMEYLQGFSAAARHQQLGVLQRSFFVPSFDVPAAYLAAGISRKAFSDRVEGSPASRQAVRTDCQIIATAVVHHATRIITNDRKHFGALAKLVPRKIEISGVPEIHEQLSLDP